MSKKKPREESNQGCERPICWELQNTERKLKMLQKKHEKISDDLGLGELMLLKWPYYTKQSIDLILSLSNYPWHFSQS